jgi:regulatory protein
MANRDLFGYRTCMSEENQKKNLRKKAMDLLALREHSAQELHRKLTAREFDEDEINAVIRELQADGLQSDIRFTEAYVRQRFKAGLGPLKIRFELRQKGVDDAITETLLEPLSGRWDDSMEKQRVRRFGEAIPQDHPERMKQARFLQNRGFSPEAVMRLFR